MYHHKGYRKLNRKSPHRKAMLRNSAVSLFTYGKIKTALTIAKEVRRLCERIITYAKHGRHSLVASTIRDKSAFQKVFQFAAKYANRKGGYTRIIKTGPRKGDMSPQAIIEFVE